MHQFKIPIIKRQDYTAYIEQHADYTFLHCDVYRWNHRTLKALKTDFEQLEKLHGGPFYIVYIDKKQAKFAELFGFHFHSVVIDPSGNQQILYIRHSTNGFTLRGLNGG